MTGSTSKTVSLVSSRGTGFPVRGYGAARWCPGEGFLGRALRPDSVEFDHTRSQGKRRAGRKPSGRCPPDYREG